MIDVVKIIKKLLFFPLLVEIIGFGWLMISSKMDLYALIFLSLILSLNIIALFLNNINRIYLIMYIIFILAFIALVIEGGFR